MEAADGMTTPVVRIRELRLRRGTRTILDGVSVDIARGEVVALMGASGSGKTTMLRSLAGLEPCGEGVHHPAVDRLVHARGSSPRAARRVNGEAADKNSNAFPRSHTAGSLAPTLAQALAG